MSPDSPCTSPSPWASRSWKRRFTSSKKEVISLRRGHMDIRPGPPPRRGLDKHPVEIEIPSRTARLDLTSCPRKATIMLRTRQNSGSSHSKTFPIRKTTDLSCTEQDRGLDSIRCPAVRPAATSAFDWFPSPGTRALAYFAFDACGLGRTLDVHLTLDRQVTQRGRVAEWSIAAVLKTVRPARVSGVRIPPLPPPCATPSTHVPV